MNQPLLYKLGRYPNCDIVMDHITISREHAEFFIDPQLNVFLSDLNSSYGTFVNSLRISEPVLLSKGDIVSFGDEQFFDWEHQFLGASKSKNPFESSVKKAEGSALNKPIDLKQLLLENKDLVFIYLAIVLMFFVIHLQTQ
jgi:pSer/pThr/pTyr-binding forkhead associated (FHA) protein